MGTRCPRKGKWFYVFQGERYGGWGCHNMAELLFCSLPSSCVSAVRFGLSVMRLSKYMSMTEVALWLQPHQMSEILGNTDSRPWNRCGIKGTLIILLFLFSLKGPMQFNGMVTLAQSKPAGWSISTRDITCILLKGAATVSLKSCWAPKNFISLDFSEEFHFTL